MRLMAFRRRQKAARRKDVLSSTGSDGCKHPVSRKIIAKDFHLFVTRSVQIDVRNRVKPNEIDAAIHAFQQPNDGFGVCRRVVNATKYDILER